MPSSTGRSHIDSVRLLDTWMSSQPPWSFSQEVRTCGEFRLRLFAFSSSTTSVNTAAIFTYLLQSWGHEVRAAHDGPSALQLAEEFRPDALLLDIGLPRMDGFTVAKRLRSAPGFERTLIVASSGYSGESDRLHASEVGIDLYLVKPFDPWHLEPILESHRASLEAAVA